MAFQVALADSAKADADSIWQWVTFLACWQRESANLAGATGATINTMRSVICRYCEESFTPLPGKPGYINECPECLHEKSHPPISKAQITTPTAVAEVFFQTLAERMKSATEIDRTTKQLKRVLMRLNVSDEWAEESAAQLRQIALKHLVSEPTRD